MISKKLDQVRSSYQNKDIELSKAQHIQYQKIQSHQENHSQSGKYIKSAVYGGLDGMITTYSVVTGSAGAQLSSLVVLALGIANLIGDGISMALGDYLSTKSEMEFHKMERDRELWEVENNPDEEKQEMKEIYLKKGLSEDEADLIIGILEKHKDFWVDTMMVEELQLLPCEENAIMNGVVTFFSFCIFGSIPIFPFFFQKVLNWNNEELFLASSIMNVIFLFVLGAIKSVVTCSQWWKSGFETLIMGIIAALASYFIGNLFQPLVGDNQF